MVRASSILALAAAALAAGCGFVPRIPGVTPYRIDIQQGNFVSQEMVAQLKPGMTKEQVRFILGTPMVTDIFHSDRWDYVYWREAPNGKRETRKVTVLFEQGQLARVDGDVLPSGGPTR
jgi:outer membrane protein assembly factor BamE